MLGMGPAGANPTAPPMVTEIDGVQLLNGGAAVEVVIDVSCAPGPDIAGSVRVSQRVPGRAPLRPRPWAP